MSIEIMPTDVMIKIFSYLAPKDVLICENISTQCLVAANYYYSKNLHRVHITHDSIALLSEKVRTCNSSFTALLMRSAGHHIVHLTIDFSVFCKKCVQAMSKLVELFCISLEAATIHGVRYARIFIPSMTGLKKLYVHNCRFKSSIDEEVSVSNTLETLVYISQTKGITSGLERLARRFPNINTLSIRTKVFNSSDCRATLSLRRLRSLCLEVVRPDCAEDVTRQMGYSDMNQFAGKLSRLAKLKNVTLILPFYMRLSETVIDRDIKALRRRANVSLVATACSDTEPCFMKPVLVKYNLLEPEDLWQLRADLSGLTAMRVNFRFSNNGDLQNNLERLVQLQSLRLTLTTAPEEFQANQAEEVFWTLCRGTNSWKCNLQEICVNALWTIPVGLDQINSIVEFVGCALKLKELVIINCTQELQDMEQMVAEIRKGLSVKFI